MVHNFEPNRNQALIVNKKPGKRNDLIGMEAPLKDTRFEFKNPCVVSVRGPMLFIFLETKT